jgi:hypothetical protein
MDFIPHTYTGGNCDSCNKERKTLYVAGVNHWDGAVEAVYCYFCMKKAEREQGSYGYG